MYIDTRLSRLPGVASMELLAATISNQGQAGRATGILASLWHDVSLPRRFNCDSRQPETPFQVRSDVEEGKGSGTCALPRNQDRANGRKIAQSLLRAEVDARRSQRAGFF